MPIQTIGTFTNGQLVTETNMNQLRDGVNNLNTGVGSRVYHNAAQSIPNTTLTALLFNTERYDTDAFHSTSSNTERLTVPNGLGGYYLLGATVRFVSNATGLRQVYLRLNGATYIAGQNGNAAAGGNIHDLNISAAYALVATDYVEVVVTQSSGGALNTEAAPSTACEFWIHRL